MELSNELGHLEIFLLFYRLIGCVEQFIEEKIGTFGLCFKTTNSILCSETQILSMIVAIIITLMGVICRHAGIQFDARRVVFSSAFKINENAYALKFNCITTGSSRRMSRTRLSS